MATNLEELLTRAREATSPAAVADLRRTPVGGVDPLGLRQVNFDMMDQVLPGLNNVASSIRPFLMMTWAWRLCGRLVERTGESSVDVMRDFVDRLEAIFAWSQFLANPDSDLPGSQALTALSAADEYRFEGEGWQKLRDTRRFSTGLISPLNYGPGLRSMDWIRDLSTYLDIPIRKAGAYKSNPEDDPILEEALDAFEALIADELDHEVFTKFGGVTLTRSDAERLGSKWSMQEQTQAGQNATWKRLHSGYANAIRAKGLALVCEVAHPGMEVSDFRRRMAFPDSDEIPDDLKQVSIAWRRLQYRQLFRLALEALFYWTIELLDGNEPMTSEAIAEALLAATNVKNAAPSGREALASIETDANPVDMLDELATVIRQQRELPQKIFEALVLCVAHAPNEPEDFERADRLPLASAAKQWAEWSALSPVAFLTNIFESWIFAQHTYWSVGRGMRDARGGGKRILRLRIFIDEGGWRLTPGTRTGVWPNPTPDRLATAVSLMRQCGRLTG